MTRLRTPRISIFIGCYLFVLLSGSDAQATPGDASRLRPVAADRKTRVLCVGDSITAGGNVYGHAFGYPTLLQFLLGDRFEVRNSGSSGTTVLKAGDFPYWTRGDLENSSAWEPDAVVIMLGTNDAKPQNWKLKEQFPRDLMDMIAHYRATAGRPSVWLALPAPAYAPACCGIDPGILGNEVVKLVRQVGADSATPVIDTHTPLLGRPDLFPDGVHPLADGYRVIAGAVYQCLTGAPLIEPAGDDFLEKTTVTLRPHAAGDDVRYALDADLPPAQWTRYTGPFEVESTVQVNAAVFQAGEPAGQVTRAGFRRVPLRPAEKVEGRLAPGLTFNYYESDTGLHNPSRLTPTKTGNVPGFGLGMPHRRDKFALLIRGYLHIPRDGMYTFFTNSDDGSNLYVGEMSDPNNKIVSNFGLHGMRESRGKVPLAAGYHRIAVDYFNHADDGGLIVSYSGPGVEKQEIPAASLFHYPE